MKRLWLFCVKVYLRIGLFFYYKDIKVHGLENLPINKPTLIICNHQNALNDALLIATRIPHYAYYLTRAGVFTSTWVHKFLNSLNMLPVYRIRDGWSNLLQNNPIFKMVTSLLINSQTVVIFPEGSHSLLRRVRPFSKGFTRIIMNALEERPDLDLKLVPIGINFMRAEAFPDSVALFIGPAIPLELNDYINKSEWVRDIKSRSREAIRALTTDIPEEHYDDMVNKIETLNLNYLDPKTLNKCIESKFENCPSQALSKWKEFRKFLKLMLILNLLIPYVIWKCLVEPKIIETEFKSTFRLGIAIILVPIYLILMVVILSNWVGYPIAIIYALLIIGLELLTVKL